MRFKYYLRGVGFGIIFSTIILMTAFNRNAGSGSITEEEVVQRAQKLGMVWAVDETTQETEETEAE